MATTSSPVTFTTATTATTASPAPVLKNLLIKDASGNTQIIEVVQTGPGKFVTASGHSIKAAPAGGVKTIIRAPQTGQHTPGQNTVILASPSMGGQVIRAATTSSGATPTTIFKNAQGQRVMTFPAGTLLNSPNTTTILKATNIKTEAGTTTYIQRQPQTVNMNSPQLQNLQQVIQGGQRLYLHTTSGPQLVTTSIQNGQQIATFVTSDPSSPGSNAANILSKQQNFISPILDHTGARKRVDFPSDVSYESKRRKSEKGGKGLRHFSMKVCEKVRTKGITTYNEVADELVQEFASPNMGMSSIEQQFDQKNIRRRVYDALNVLMAMNIISKEKKEIKWLGLPTNSMQECTTLEKDRQKRIERLKAKTQQLHDLIIQQVAFKSLVERNKEKEKESGPPPPHGSIHLPFLIVNTEKNTVIDCSISSDKMEYLFNFDGTFEIHDDIEVLKRMGFALGLDNNNCSEEQLQQAKKVLPKALEMYIDQIGKRGGDDWRAEFGDLDYDDDSYFADGDVSDNVENIQFIDQATLAQHGGHTMTVDELQMRAAIESLHQESEIADEDDSYDGVEEEDEEDNGELSE